MQFTQEKAGAGIWKDDAVHRNFKQVSPSNLRQLGINLNNMRKVKNLQVLRENPPNIVVAEAIRNTTFVQNFFKEQTLKKKQKYVMGMGVYQQLHYEMNRKKRLLRPTVPQFKNIYTPYRGQELHNKTILVFRTGGIGDLLFIKPNLNYLKEKYPTCTINFACGPQYQPMVETWDCVDEMLDLPFPLSYLMKSDYHLLFEGVIERCEQAERDNAYNLFSQWLGLDLDDELLIPKQNPKEDLVEYCRELLNKWGVEENEFIIMQLRASSPIRTPRHDFWKKIIDELNKRGHKVLLTDNPRQTENIDKFIGLLENKDMTFNFCEHSKAIDYSIALTSLCKSIMATDSALNHIAASLDKKCFGIYGPFPGFIRLKTYKKAEWVDATRFCSPCFIHGHKPCKYATMDGYSPCYDELIETDEKLFDLIDQFEEFLEK